MAVPFAAVKGFFDPSVQFGLQFQEVVEAAGEHSGQPEQRATGANDAPPVEHKAIAPAVTETPTEADTDAARTTPDNSTAGGEVVQLDRFRKK